MSSHILLVTNRLTNSEKYSRISWGTDILAILADDRVPTIWKPCTILR